MSSLDKLRRVADFRHLDAARQRRRAPVDTSLHDGEATGKNVLVSLGQMNDL
ncbi:MAG: hypothetical protein O7G88_09110 [bacterium]|nr:hypothetical protein [bacterium]